MLMLLIAFNITSRPDNALHTIFVVKLVMTGVVLPLKKKTIHYASLCCCSCGSNIMLLWQKNDLF